MSAAPQTNWLPRQQPSARKRRYKWIGSGLALILLAIGVQEVKSRFFNSHAPPAVTLWVLEKNVLARRFYEARGFVFDAARKEETIGGLLLTELRYEKRMFKPINRSDSVSPGTPKLQAHHRCIPDPATACIDDSCSSSRTPGAVLVFSACFVPSVART